MAKTIQTLSPEFIEELIWTVNRVKGMVNGGLRGEELPLSRASDGVVVVTPSDGITARDEGTLYGEYCYLYKITDTTYGDDEISLEAILDGSGNCLTQKVFNASRAAATGDSYFVSELFRSGHRYVSPTEDERLKFWRVSYSSTNNTTSGNTEVYLWSTAESRWAVAATEHPDATYSASPKTITFNLAGKYRVGVNLQVGVNSGTASPEIKVACEPGVWRSGAFVAAREYALNICEVSLPTGYGSGSGDMRSFCETHLTVLADDVLAVRFSRSGDVTRSVDMYAHVTVGRMWT